MKRMLPLLLLPLAALAVPLGMVDVETPDGVEPAPAWAARPLTTRAATFDYVRTLVATSSYDAAMGQVHGILSGYTERFSPDWSYWFRGGGLSVDFLHVTDALHDSGDFDAASLDTGFLVSTNRATVGSIDAGVASLRGPASADLSSKSSFDSLSAGAVDTTFLLAPGGRVVFDAPAVFFTSPPMFPALYGQTNDPPSALFHAYGEFGFHHYAQGLLHFATTNNGPFRFSTVSGIGLFGDGASATYDVGPSGRKFADWTCVPVVTTLRPTADPAYALGFWDTTQAELSAAASRLTNAVAALFAATNVVAGYAGEAALLASSPSYAAAMDVRAWAALNGSPQAATDFEEASASLVNRIASDGVVSVAYRTRGLVVDYARYRQMRPPAHSLSRVSVNLSIHPGYEFPTNAARYHLVINGRRILTRTVSAHGETGPAFAVVDTTASDPGYLYLDVSEIRDRHGTNVLHACSYYVTITALKGQKLWRK